MTTTDKMKSRTSSCALLYLAGALTMGIIGRNHGLQAQTVGKAEHQRADVAVTFAADRTNPVNGANQWLLGGAAEVGVNAWKGLGVAARFAGSTTEALGSQRVPLNLLITTVGPRYRFEASHNVSVYGEGLFGEAHGFRSLFPTTTGVETNASSLAVEVGGGIDWVVQRHLAVRALEANWLRTQFPNGTTGVQNHLLLGAGLDVRF